MSEIEVDLDGTEVEVVCRKCDGEGLVSYEKVVMPFRSDKGEVKYYEKVIETPAHICDECDGEGSYFAIVKQGTIHVDVLPRYA